MIKNTDNPSKELSIFFGLIAIRKCLNIFGLSSNAAIFCVLKKLIILRQQKNIRCVDNSFTAGAA
jgi:hypothetical protein